MVNKDKDLYHIKYNEECMALINMVGTLSNEVSIKNSVVYNLEIKFLRKVMREINIVRDVLGGATHIPTGLKVTPKSPETTPIIIRNAYESYVYWKYLANNKDKEFYTYAYYYQESLDTSDMLYSKFEETFPFNQINIHDAGIQEAKATWNRQLKEFHKGRAPYPQWYSLKDGAKSFSQMNRSLNLTEPFKKIYNFCSKANHGMGLNKEIIKNEENVFFLKAVYHIDPIHEKYLWFLSWKLLCIINQDISEFYIDSFKS